MFYFKLKNVVSIPCVISIHSNGNTSYWHLITKSWNFFIVICLGHMSRSPMNTALKISHVLVYALSHKDKN